MERRVRQWKEIKRERYVCDGGARGELSVFVCVLPWRGRVQRTCICRVQRRKACPSGPGSASSCGPQRPEDTKYRKLHIHR